MDKRLENQRFLFGDYITDSDIRLYTTLARFDYSYSRNIGPCVHRLVDYKNCGHMQEICIRSRHSDTIHISKISQHLRILRMHRKITGRMYITTLLYRRRTGIQSGASQPEEKHSVRIRLISGKQKNRQKTDTKTGGRTDGSNPCNR